jgi:hypothetical protein
MIIPVDQKILWLEKRPAFIGKISKKRKKYLTARIPPCYSSATFTSRTMKNPNRRTIERAAAARRSARPSFPPLDTVGMIM